MSGWNYVSVGPDGRTSLARHELYDEVRAALYERANTVWLLGGHDNNYHYPYGVGFTNSPHCLNYWPPFVAVVGNPWQHGDAEGNPPATFYPEVRDLIDSIGSCRAYFNHFLFDVYYSNLGCKEATPPLRYVLGTAAAGEINLFEDAGLPAWITAIGEIGEWEVGDEVEMEHSPILWTGAIVAIMGQNIQVAFATGNPAVVNANAAYGVWNATKFLDAGVAVCSECDWTIGATQGGPDFWMVDCSLFTDFEALCNTLTFFRCPDAAETYMGSPFPFGGTDPIAKPTADIYLGYLWFGPVVYGISGMVEYNNPAAVRFVLYFQAKFTGSAGGSLVVQMSPDFDAGETPLGDTATWVTLATIANPDDGAWHWYKAETTDPALWRGDSAEEEYPVACLRLDTSSRSEGDDTFVQEGRGYFEFDWAYHA